MEETDKLIPIYLIPPPSPTAVLSKQTFRFDTGIPVAQTVAILFDKFMRHEVQRDYMDFILRMAETDEKLNDDNKFHLVMPNAYIKLVLTPNLEAADCLEKLRSADLVAQKKMIFQLQKLVKDPDVAHDFIAKGGVAEVVKLVSVSGPQNLTAYALTTLLNLLDYDDAVTPITFSAAFINTLVILLTNRLINVSRPSTLIVTKLIAHAETPESNPYFAKVFVAMQGLQPDKENGVVRPGLQGLLDKVVERITSNDPNTLDPALRLINAIYEKVFSLEEQAAFKPEVDLWLREAEGTGVLRAIIKLMQNIQFDDRELTDLLLDFQRVYLRALHQRKRRAVQDADFDARMAVVAQVVVDAGGRGHMPQASAAAAGTAWRAVGFVSENPRKEMERYGVFGLSALYTLVTRNRDAVTKMVADSASHTAERQCPFARAAMISLEVLCDVWDISAGFSTSLVLKPLLLDFDAVLCSTLRAFYQYFSAMEASVSDIEKVYTLLHAHVRAVLRGPGAGGAAGAAGSPSLRGARSVRTDASASDSAPSIMSAQQPAMTIGNLSLSNGTGDSASSAGGSQRLEETRESREASPYYSKEMDLTAFAYEKAMLGASIKQLKERYLLDNDLEELVHRRFSLSLLRDQLFTENMDWLKAQRVACLQRGAWFPVPFTKGKEWRFVRLHRHRKTLHFGSFSDEERGRWERAMTGAAGATAVPPPPPPTAAAGKSVKVKDDGSAGGKARCPFFDRSDRRFDADADDSAGVKVDLSNTDLKSELAAPMYTAAGPELRSLPNKLNLAECGVMLFHQSPLFSGASAKLMGRSGEPINPQLVVSLVDLRLMAETAAAAAGHGSASTSALASPSSPTRPGGSTSASPVPQGSSSGGGSGASASLLDLVCRDSFQAAEWHDALNLLAHSTTARTAATRGGGAGGTRETSGSFSSGISGNLPGSPLSASSSPTSPMFRSGGDGDSFIAMRYGTLRKGHAATGSSSSGRSAASTSNLSASPVPGRAGLLGKFGTLRDTGNNGGTSLSMSNLADTSPAGPPPPLPTSRPPLGGPASGAGVDRMADLAVLHEESLRLLEIMTDAEMLSRTSCFGLERAGQFVRTWEARAAEAGVTDLVAAQTGAIAVPICPAWDNDLDFALS